MPGFCLGGTIVGFDNDDASVFDLQRRFAEQSRIAQMMLQVLFAIPQTPLYKRLEQEGRLCDSFLMSNWGTAAATNVVPLRMTIEELREGYLKLLEELYHPDAFFGRMDAMCFETGWLPAPGRTRYLRRHPLRRLRLRSWAGIEALYIFVQLMRRVPDPILRRRYRRQLLKVLMRRPEPEAAADLCNGLRRAFPLRQADRAVQGDASGGQRGRERWSRIRLHPAVRRRLR